MKRNNRDHKIDATFDVKKANKIIFTVMLLLIAFVYFLYANTGGTSLFNDLLLQIKSYEKPLFFLVAYLIVLIFLIMLYTYMHAFFIIIFGKIKRDNIKVVYNEKTFMPYVSYDIPVPISAFRWSIFMPYLILCIFPVVIGIMKQIPTVVFAGTLTGLCATGDIIMLFNLAKYDKDYHAVSNPSKYGCILYKDK